MPPTQSANALSFFEEHYDRIYRYVVGVVHDSTEAEDLTQETFLRAYRQRDSLREPGALLAWLYRIATHAPSIDCVSACAARRANQKARSKK